ncbi:MAG: methyltransferase family protein [Candidatus Limnocylindria bacterium]
MTPSLVTLVVVGSACVYFIVALALRARAVRERGPSIRRIGGLPRTLPYFVWVPYAVVALRLGPETELPEPVRWAGLGIAVAGIAFAIWAALTLGRHFDMEVEVHGGHEVITSGPYAIVRHPVYSGLALQFLGACLATGNWLLVLGTLLMSFPAFWYRARAEERLLERELPAYAEYARRVGMLLPGIR